MSKLIAGQGGKVVLAGLLLVVAATIVLWPRPKPKRSGQYFYDLGDKKLYEEQAGVNAPAKAPSGGEGVLAAVFACGSCDDPSGHFVAYLSKNSDEYMKALQSSEPMRAEVAREGTLYRAVDGESWFSQSSPQAMQMMQGVSRRCPEGTSAVACAP